MVGPFSVNPLFGSTVWCSELSSGAIARYNLLIRMAEQMQGMAVRVIQALLRAPMLPHSRGRLAEDTSPA